MITVRVRGPSGATTLKLDDAALVRDLADSLATATGIAAGSQEVRLGHPPKPVDLSTTNAPIASLGVTNGVTLIVSSGAGSSTPVRPAPVVSAVASSSKPTVPAAAAPAPKPAPAAKTLPRVTARYGDQHLILRRVPDDNACLFHAAALVLTPGAADGSTKLRRIVADAVLGDRETYSEPVLGQSPEAYARKMLEPNAWGGAIELAILSAHFRTEIDSCDIKSGRIDRFGEGQYSSRVLLVYAGIHYDALTASFVTDSDAEWPYRGDALAFDILTFDTTDDSVLIAAQGIADQLRKAHAYTDTATFTLRCGVCGDGLTGEKAAVDHAKSTGHQAFTEYS